MFPSRFLFRIALILAAGSSAWLPIALHAAPTMPVLHPKDTVVLIGDSITDGGRARKGNDYNHTMGQSYAFIVSAILGDQLAERDLTFINRGISGDCVPDLQARWKTDVLDLKPNFLSILVGVNDTLFPKNGGETVEQYEQGYDQLLSETLAALPGVKIVLGQPFLLPVGKFKATYAASLAEVKKAAGRRRSPRGQISPARHSLPGCVRRRLPPRPRRPLDVGRRASPLRGLRPHGRGMDEDGRGDALTPRPRARFSRRAPPDASR